MRISIENCIDLANSMGIKCLSNTVTNDTPKIDDGQATWVWLPLGGGGQYYIQAELTLNDFYRLMFEKVEFPDATPRKVLKTYYRT